MAGRTPSQTVGPFFSEALRWRDGGVVTFAPPAGDRIAIEGRIFDGAGAPVGDALVETWQVGPDGAYGAAASGDARPHGFGRLTTDDAGAFRIETKMPGGGAPCLEVTILARGLLKALRTRVYLVGSERVAGDPALAALAGSPRLETLVARPAAPARFQWNVRLQGEGETVFFSG